MTNTFSNVANEILRLIPEGGSIGNGKCVRGFSFPVTPEDYAAGKKELLDAGVVVQGRGRGGSLRRASDVVAAPAVDAPTGEAAPAEGSAEDPSDVPAPEAPVSGAGTTAIASVSAGEDGVVRPMVAKPYINMSAWMLEILDVMAEFGCTHPTGEQTRKLIEDNKVNTDIMMEFHSQANDIMIDKHGVCFHFNKGLVKN